MAVRSAGEGDSEKTRIEAKQSGGEGFRLTNIDKAIANCLLSPEHVVIVHNIKVEYGNEGGIQGFWMELPHSILHWRSRLKRKKEYGSKKRQEISTASSVAPVHQSRPSIHK
ncbi:conserved hypothetical protein [Ricinus communis]|uniref:Uncharacterized protein n=1 Tax=Ricinus communis TaxID=3988 RepID=B9STN3_RICCO|nr:conserved hypothetical protein [Ricinus communis]